MFNLGRGAPEADDKVALGAFDLRIGHVKSEFVTLGNFAELTQRELGGAQLVARRSLAVVVERPEREAHGEQLILGSFVDEVRVPNRVERLIGNLRPMGFGV